jgi:hypothetical protein
MPHIEEVNDDYDLDAALDEAPVSNFLPQEQEIISKREELELQSPDETGISFTTVVAFIMSCCIAHFILVTGGFTGKTGMAKLDGFAEKLQDFFTKYSIQIPEGVELM